MGTKGQPGNGNQEPGRGLMDIPKLSAQRKEEIRDGIMTEIRSWKKEPDTPQRTSLGRFGKRGVIGTVGAGLAAVLLAVVLVQTDRTGDSGTAVAPVAPSVNGGPIGGQAGVGGVDSDDINKNEEGLPEGVADLKVTLTYGEFLNRWKTASKSSEELSRLTALRGENPTFSGSIPGLGETLQSFGEAGSDDRFKVWTDNQTQEGGLEGARMREMEFTFMKTSGGEAQSPNTTKLLRFVTNVLQPELSDEDREELLDSLRFRDFESKTGSRIAESAGLLYTISRDDEGLKLAVRFLREEGQSDGMGELQDGLLDILQGRGSDSKN
ncbi:hypothetical protein B9G55_11890 [Saccharibacillus sp. O16]|nr:hypothetical protein B9G55_11890 [Saccharibacillus sp. O16]